MNPNEVIDLVRVYRDGTEKRESMPRWLAELYIACIPNEEPGVARARIEPIVVHPHSPYPIKSDAVKARATALWMGGTLTARKVD